LLQWYLEPAETRAVFTPPLYRDRFEESLASDWVWEDPFADCCFSLQKGLEIRAANGRGLWHLNFSAPRMLRPIPKGMDWAAQTICDIVTNEMQAVGGLVLWRDRKNWLHLTRGAWSSNNVTLFGCVDNHDVVIGRGHLSIVDPANRETGDARIWLRLECAGGQVKALCSADGQMWFMVGSVAFPAEEPAQIGLLATCRLHLGWMNRYVFRSSHPAGTAIRFESFTLWRLDD
jgi:regulation of enolase protein 1 (concanavalin A-like superfamily)